MTTVLYTGANGRMATVLRESLAGEFDAVKLFVRSEPESLFENEKPLLGDLRDLAAVERACEGVDVIIHLGGIADEAPFEDIMGANIEGCYNVFEAARRQGVRRIVFASSNHATGFYPVTETIAPEDPPRPDTYYGVSKVFGEALGRLYHDKWGMEVVNIRIGTFRPEPENVRQLSMWLSHRDAAELTRCAVLAPGVGYLTLFGVSANSNTFWNNDAAAAQLGYKPQDNAQDFAAKLASRGMADPVHVHQGGQFTGSDYRGGTW